MKTIATLLLALSLAACGGGGDASAVADEESNTSSPVHVEVVTQKPLTVPAESVMESETCKASKASQSGIEHGKPPVARC